MQSENALPEGIHWCEECQGFYFPPSQLVCKCANPVPAEIDPELPPTLYKCGRCGRVHLGDFTCYCVKAADGIPGDEVKFLERLYTLKDARAKNARRRRAA
jgi:hypothetical protein